MANTELDRVFDKIAFYYQRNPFLEDKIENILIKNGSDRNADDWTAGLNLQSAKKALSEIEKLINEVTDEDVYDLVDFIKEDLARDLIRNKNKLHDKKVFDKVNKLIDEIESAIGSRR